MERVLRGMAGTIILISVALTYYADERWLFLTAFVGLNLLQSAFTNWCPAMAVLKKIGIK